MRSTPRMARTYAGARAEKCQFVSASAEELHRRNPEVASLGVGALFIARVYSPDANFALVRNHRIVPARKPGTQRDCLGRTNRRSNYRVRIHVRRNHPLLFLEQIAIRRMSPSFSRLWSSAAFQCVRGISF